MSHTPIAPRNVWAHVAGSLDRLGRRSHKSATPSPPEKSTIAQINRPALRGKCEPKMERGNRLGTWTASRFQSWKLRMRFGALSYSAVPPFVPREIRPRHIVRYDKPTAFPASFPAVRACDHVLHECARERHLRRACR